MTTYKHGDMRDNCSRALGFLHLAIEQLRLIDADKANFIRKYHYNQLSTVFKDALSQAEQIETVSSGHNSAKALEIASNQQAHGGIEELPLAPPGLGMGIFPETTLDRGEASLSAVSKTSSNTFDSFDSMDFQLTTRTRESVIIGLTPESEKRLLSSLLDNSDPLDPYILPNTQAAIARPQPQLQNEGPDPQIEMLRSEELETNNEWSSAKSTSFPSVDKNIDATSDFDVQPQIPAQHGNSTVTSWANVAAIPRSKVEIRNAFKGHLNGGVSKETTAPFRRNSSTSLPLQTPTEPLSEQYRVVWVAGLPSTYTSYDISSKIDQGPIMSILIEENLSDRLPGRSACIIFQHAAHASAFVAANEEHSAQIVSNATPPSPRNDPDDHQTKSIANTLYAFTAPNARILPGAVFPLDDDLQLMNPPTLARRRLKWSRSRLFYEVSLYRFKTDLYRVVGKSNVELVHFYNPGEATVVFSSVRVAKTVKKTWEAWSGASSSPRRTSSGHKGNGKSSGEEGSTVLRPGKHPLDPMRGADPKVLYRGTEVSFVHDFNEVPVRLVSQYGSDGRVRKCSGGKAGVTDGGVEGIFSGPEISL